MLYTKSKKLHLPHLFAPFIPSDHRYAVGFGNPAEREVAYFGPPNKTQNERMKKSRLSV